MLFLLSFGVHMVVVLGVGMKGVSLGKSIVGVSIGGV